MLPELEHQVIRVLSRNVNLLVLVQLQHRPRLRFCSAFGENAFQSSRRKTLGDRVEEILVLQVSLVSLNEIPRKAVAVHKKKPLRKVQFDVHNGRLVSSAVSSDCHVHLLVIYVVCSHL